MKKLIITSITILFFLIPKAYGQHDAIYYLKLSSQKLHDFSIPESTRHLQALHLAHMAVSLDTNFADAYYTRGVCNRELGNLDKSMRDFSKVISLEPHNYYAYSCRADIKFRQNDILGSIEDYSFVLKNEPNHEVYYWRGKVFLSNKDFVNAISDFTQVIKYNSAWVMESYYLRAQSNLELNKFRLSLIDIDSAINSIIQTTDSLEISKYYSLKGVICAKLLNDNEAINNFLKSIEFNSNNSVAFYNRGLTYARLNNFKLAIEDFTKSILINPLLTDAFTNRGLAKKEINDAHGAVNDYSSAIELNPTDYKIYYYRGFSKMYLEDYLGAVRDFNSTIVLNPKFQLAYEGRADANYALKEYQKAIDDYNVVIANNPRNKWAYFFRGNSFKKTGQVNNACSDWKKAKSLGFAEADIVIKNFCH
jgi:tetratricopeptide (TPR) repeat protein